MRRDPLQPRGLKGTGGVLGLPGLGAGAQLSCAVWGLLGPGLGSGPGVSRRQTRVPARAPSSRVCAEESLGRAWGVLHNSGCPPCHLTQPSASLTADPLPQTRYYRPPGGQGTSRGSSEVSAGPRAHCHSQGTGLLVPVTDVVLGAWRMLGTPEPTPVGPLVC